LLKYLRGVLICILSPLSTRSEESAEVGLVQRILLPYSSWWIGRMVGDCPLRTDRATHTRGLPSSPLSRPFRWNPS